MPFQLSQTTGYVSVTACGQVTGADLLQLHSDLSGVGPEHQKCLIDFTDADVSQLTGPIVRELSALPPRFERLAIVARTGNAYGLGRTYQAYSRGRTIGVFMTVENALAWLQKGTRSGTYNPTDASPAPRLHPLSQSKGIEPPARTG